MSFKRCPGSMSFTQPKIELVRCPHCKEVCGIVSHIRNPGEGESLNYRIVHDAERLASG